jgi:hypothetical protein
MDKLIVIYKFMLDEIVASQDDNTFHEPNGCSVS